MTVDITAARRVADTVRYRAAALCALAGIGLGLVALPAGALGADFGAGYRTAMIPRSSPATAGRRPVLDPAIDPPDLRRHIAMDAGTVDRLYRELMRSSACVLGTGQCR
jgi:hypothetical protein